jgi:predicted glycoside hydrolase/deacetylase ChbG (UPF0249 family)
MRILKNVLLLFLIGLVACSTSAQEHTIRVIVRGDDMGYSHSGNEALIKCFKEGIQTSIEVIVPSPWFPEAVKMLADNPGTDVGIHLAITSEWDNVKWRPLTDCPSLRDADGYFYPMIWPNKNYPGRALKDNQWRVADVEKEFRAQIELALKKIPRISHISAHMGCTNISDSVSMITSKLAKEFNIDIDLEKMGVEYFGYDGLHKTSGDKIKSFIKALEKLKPGKTYLFVDHPGLDSPELRAVHHIGYEEVAIDRQGVTDAWTSPAVKDAIRRRGIKLISYKDLRE